MKKIIKKILLFYFIFIITASPAYCEFAFIKEKISENIFAGIKTAISTGLITTPIGVAISFIGGMLLNKPPKKNEEVLRSLEEINKRIDEEFYILKQDLGNLKLKNVILIESINKTLVSLNKLNKNMENISYTLISISHNLRELNNHLSSNIVEIKKMFIENVFSNYKLALSYFNSYLATKNLDELNLAREYILKFKTLAESDVYYKKFNIKYYSISYVILSTIYGEYFLKTNKSSYLLQITNLFNEIINSNLLNYDEKFTLIPVVYLGTLKYFKNYQNYENKIKKALIEFYIKGINYYLKLNDFNHALKIANTLRLYVKDSFTNKLYNDLKYLSLTGNNRNKNIDFNDEYYKKICNCIILKNAVKDFCSGILTPDNLVYINKKYKNEILAKKSIQLLLNRGYIEKAYVVLKNSEISDEFFILKTMLIIYDFKDKQKKDMLKRLILNNNFPDSLKKWVIANVN